MSPSKNSKRSSPVKTRYGLAAKLSDTIPLNGPQNLGEFGPGVLMNSVVLGVSNKGTEAVGAGAVTAIAENVAAGSGVAIEAGSASSVPPGESKKNRRKRLAPGSAADRRNQKKAKTEDKRTAALEKGAAASILAAGGVASTSGSIPVALASSAVDSGLKESEADKLVRDAAIAEDTAKQLLASILAIADTSDDSGLPMTSSRPNVKKPRITKHKKVATRSHDPTPVSEIGKKRELLEASRLHAEAMKERENETPKEKERIKNNLARQAYLRMRHERPATP